MALAPLVFAAVVMEAAAIVAWPMHHPAAGLVLLAAYVAQQVWILFRATRPAAPFMSRRPR